MSPSIEPLPLQDLNGLLKQSLGKNFQIQHIEWRPLTDPGENFGSMIIAINADIVRENKTETFHLVGKLPPRSAYLLDLFNSPVTFKKELHFYSLVAKEFINIQLESGIPKQEVRILAPNYLGGRLGLQNPKEFDEQAAIILENLKYLGYTSEDRIFGLDERHTAFAVQELAKLHALTIALKIKKPDFFENVVVPILKQTVNETAEKCVVDMIRKAQEDIRNINEAAPYMERINRTIEYGIETLKTAKKAEEPWATLVHNDFWVNNMMFQHNERGQLIDMKIVDFQLCLYDYGMKDLIFFLVSSATKDVLDNKLNDMIDLYYDAFTKLLKILNINTEMFSKSKYDELINYCGPIKFNQCIMMSQVIQASRGSATPLDEIQSEDTFLGNRGDDIYRQKLLHIVQIFDKTGWLLK